MRSARQLLRRGVAWKLQERGRAFGVSGRNVMSEPVFYINGKFVKKDHAEISILDLGLLRGYGAFDFLRTYGGRLFKLRAHLLRLQNSCREIGLKFPWSLRRLSDIVSATLDKNRFAESNVKILVTGGVSPDQLLPSGKPSLCVLVTPVFTYPESCYSRGVKVVTVGMQRFLPRSKSTHYIPGILALQKARREKALDALYLSEKQEILEGTTSNFFVFKGDVLVTPEMGVLLGITRSVVLDLARKEFEIQLRPIPCRELKDAGEAFLTASNKEVMPVVNVDGVPIGEGKVGANTRRIMQLFREYTARGAGIA